MPANLDSIDDLKPAPYNPRKISTRAAKGLAKSMAEYGDAGGIVWNARTGHLVTGHQRVAQLQGAGAQLVDGAIVLNGERFLVRVVDWPESKERAANIAANNPHLAGDFTDGLGDILADIKLSIEDEDFTGLRFDELLSKGWRRGEGHVQIGATRGKAREFYTMPDWLVPQWEKATHILVQFSGGKDSTGAALWAAHHVAGKQFQLCFSDPGVEFPGISDHVVAVTESIKAEAVILKSPKDWWQWLRIKGEWPSLLFRPCAMEFVHAPFAKHVRKAPEGQTIVLTGSRGTEAVRGSKKTERSSLQSLGNKAEAYQHYAPCFATDKNMLEKIIKSSGVPLWEGYGRGFVRTACWCCPAQCGLQAIALVENYPGLAEDIRRWEKRLGPVQPAGSAGPVTFDDLVARGQRQRKRAAKKRDEIK